MHLIAASASTTRPATVSSLVAWAAVIGLIALLVFVAGWFRRRMLWATEIAVIALGAYLLSRAGFDAATSDGSDVAHAFVRGGNATFSALLRPLFPGSAGPVPGSYGWLTVVGVAVVLFVLMDRRTAKREVPSVSVDTTVAPGDPALPAPLAPLVSEVQFRLPAVDVRRPSAIPGGQALDSLASIVESTDLTGSRPLAAVMRLLRVFYAPPPSFVVRLYVEEGPPGAGAMITVDLRDAATNQTRQVHTLGPCALSEAAERVAGYVARQVLEADPTAPRWSGGPADGADLALSLLAQQCPTARSYDAALAQRRQQRDRLDAVVHLSPPPALAIYELASLDDLDAEHLGALRLHLINREHHPEFRRGQYRLAMSMCMIAGDTFTDEWSDARRWQMSTQVRQDIAALMERVGMLSPRSDAYVLGLLAREQPPDTGEALELRRALLRLALGEFDDRRRALSVRNLLTVALVHRHRRTELLAYLRNKRGRQRRIGDRWATAIAMDIANTRLARLRDSKDPPLPRAVGRILDPPRRPRWWPPRRRPSWQSLYNAACFCAIPPLGHPDGPDERPARAERVVALLRRAVDDPRCELVRPSEWIGKDPDLADVRHTRAFDRFVGELVERDFGPEVERPSAPDPGWFPGIVEDRALSWQRRRAQGPLIDVSDAHLRDDGRDEGRDHVAAEPVRGPGQAPGPAR